jgi:hypothetical protein
MKTKIIVALSLLVGFISCKKEAKVDRTILSSSIAANKLTVDSNYVKLDNKKKADPAMTFSWDAPDYGFESVQLYALQVDKAGNDFKKGTHLTIDLGPLMTASITHEQADLLLKSYGIADSALGNMVVRIKTTLAYNDKVEPVYSNTLSVSARRFDPPPALLYVPGDYQGWDPSTAQKLTFNPAAGQYEAVVDMAKAGGTGEFKITSQPNWDGTNYGDGGAGLLSTSGGNLNLTPGTYSITANTQALTWTSSLENWGLIGSATAGGWGSDQDMQYDQALKMYTITTNLLAGEIKFRKNDDWPINLGDNGNDGSLEPGGSNIPVASDGNYSIKLDVANNTFTIIKN